MCSPVPWRAASMRRKPCRSRGRCRTGHPGSPQSRTFRRRTRQISGASDQAVTSPKESHVISAVDPASGRSAAATLCLAPTFVTGTATVATVTAVTVMTTSQAEAGRPRVQDHRNAARRTRRTRLHTPLDNIKLERCHVIPSVDPACGRSGCRDACPRADVVRHRCATVATVAAVTVMTTSHAKAERQRVRDHRSCAIRAAAGSNKRPKGC